MSRAVWLGTLTVYLLCACGDGTLRAFEPQLGQPGDSAGQGPEAQDGAGGDAASEAGDDASEPGAGDGASEADAGDDVSARLLIDDFEDGDSRANTPLGYWYPVNDKSAAQGFGIEPVSRSSTSVYALQSHGSGFRLWGAAVGVDLVGDAAPLDLRSYNELCFQSRVESGSSTLIQVHWLRGSQHYIRELQLSESWTRYCLPLAEFRSQSGEALVANELVALQFFFAQTAAFLFWIDDVEVVRE